MNYIFIILITLLVGFPSCNNPSSDIKNSFDSVNNSITQANSLLKTSYEELYSTIRAKHKDGGQLLTFSDRIYEVTKTAVDYIDSLQAALNNKDSTGEDLKIAEKLLINTKAGEQLKENLTDVYLITRLHVMDSSRKRYLDSVQITLRLIANEPAWTKMYFKTTPTMAAVTILHKLRNDCELSSLQSLIDINERLK